MRLLRLAAHAVAKAYHCGTAAVELVTISRWFDHARWTLLYSQARRHTSSSWNDKSRRQVAHHCCHSRCCFSHRCLLLRCHSYVVSHTIILLSLTLLSTTVSLSLTPGSSYGADHLAQRQAHALPHLSGGDLGRKVSDYLCTDGS